MKKHSSTLLIFICFFSLSSQVIANSWNAYIPLNKQLKVKVMQLGSSTEIKQITQKMQNGIMKHPQWFQSYIKDLKPGQMMPYHANLGLTKNEYKKFLAETTHPGLKQIGTLDILFQQENNGDIKIKTEQKSPLNGLIINQTSVDTPFGKATKYTAINNLDKNSPTGPWQGVQWNLSDFDEKLIKKNIFEAKGKEIKFAIGRLANTGEGILYYDVKDFDIPAGKRIQISYIIFYPL